MAYKGIEIIIVYKRHLFTKSLKKSVSKFTYSSASLTSLVSLSTLKTINSPTNRLSSLSRWGHLHRVHHQFVTKSASILHLLRYTCIFFYFFPSFLAPNGIVPGYNHRVFEGVVAHGKALVGQDICHKTERALNRRICPWYAHDQRGQKTQVWKFDTLVK